MGPVSTETVIDAPRERVFEVLCDLSLRPAFCDHFLGEYRLARIPATGKGAAARFRVRNTWMDTAIAEVDSPHLVAERGHSGRLNRIPVFTAWELHEGPGAMTTVRVIFSTEPANPIDRARERFGSERWYRRQWSLALRRLRALIEGEEPIPHVGNAGGDRVPSVAG